MCFVIEKCLPIDLTNDLGNLLVNTVDRNKSKYSCRLYSETVRSCELQDNIGRPSKKHDLIEFVEVDIILTCPITIEDIKKAENI